MSTVATPSTTDGHGDSDPVHAHNPHLAHHFDTPEQQIASGKLGIWLFLATEILMFGGLFCAYSVYRHNHPEVFSFAHHFLNKWLGGINTVVLIASSLTMAWGVRASQLGKNRQLIGCLIATIMGGYIFMGIKAIEYRTKWEHHLWVGQSNQFNMPNNGGAAPAAVAAPAAGGGTGHADAAGNVTEKTAKPVDEHNPGPAHPAPGHAKTDIKAPVATSQPIVALIDPNAGTNDAAAIRPPAFIPGGRAPEVVKKHVEAEEGHEENAKNAAYYALPGKLDRQRVYTFFQTYFVMTGLHGVHVLVGMGLIFWILLRAVGKPARGWVLPLGLMTIGLFLLYVLAIVHLDEKTAAASSAVSTTRTVAWIIIGLTGLWFLVGFMRARAAKVASVGEFGPQYFAPVDVIGLYWHIVDLIWIFLFPLLYLIH